MIQGLLMSMLLILFTGGAIWLLLAVERKSLDQKGRGEASDAIEVSVQCGANGQQVIEVPKAFALTTDTVTFQRKGNTLVITPKDESATDLAIIAGVTAHAVHDGNAET